MKTLFIVSICILSLLSCSREEEALIELGEPKYDVIGINDQADGSSTILVSIPITTVSSTPTQLENQFLFENGSGDKFFEDIDDSNLRMEQLQFTWSYRFDTNSSVTEKYKVIGMSSDNQMIESNLATLVIMRPQGAN